MQPRFASLLVSICVAVTAVAAALAILLTLYMVDNLLNAMINPVFMLAAGALAGQSVNTAQRTRAVRRPNKTNKPAARPTHTNHASAINH